MKEKPYGSALGLIDLVPNCSANELDWIEFILIGDWFRFFAPWNFLVKSNGHETCKLPIWFSFRCFHQTINRQRLTASSASFSVIAECTFRWVHIVCFSFLSIYQKMMKQTVLKKKPPLQWHLFFIRSNILYHHFSPVCARTHALTHTVEIEESLIAELRWIIARYSVSYRVFAQMKQI